MAALFQLLLGTRALLAMVPSRTVAL